VVWWRIVGGRLGWVRSRGVRLGGWVGRGVAGTLPSFSDSLLPLRQHRDRHSSTCRIAWFSTRHTKILNLLTKNCSYVRTHRFLGFTVPNRIIAKATLHSRDHAGQLTWKLQYHHQQMARNTQGYRAYLRTSISPFLSAIGPIIQMDTTACI